MTSPKEWAIANGYDVKPGRGRMAKHITDAYRAAMSGQPVSQSAPVVKAKPAPRPENGVVETAPPVWPDSTIAYAYIDGKKVACSMRQCCFHCRVSLQWCGCGAPKALVTNASGYIPVTLEIP